MDKGFTSRLEDDLDRVAKGDEGWIELLDGFWEPFSHTLQHAEENMRKVQQPEEPTGEACPDCGNELMIRSGRYGKFIGCSNYPECTYRRRLLKKVGVTCRTAKRAMSWNGGPAGVGSFSAAAGIPTVNTPPGPGRVLRRKTAIRSLPARETI